MQDGDSCFLEEKGRLGHPTPEKTEAVLTLKLMEPENAFQQLNTPLHQFGLDC